MLIFKNLQLEEQTLLPQSVGVGIGLTVGLDRLDDLNFLKRSEGFVVVGIDACANTGTLGCADRAVGIVELNGGSAHAGQRVAEQRTEKHIGMSGMYLAQLHAHLLHHLHAIHE